MLGDAEGGRTILLGLVERRAPRAPSSRSPRAAPRVTVLTPDSPAQSSRSPKIATASTPPGTSAARARAQAAGRSSANGSAKQLRTRRHGRQVDGGELRPAGLDPVRLDPARRDQGVEARAGAPYAVGGAVDREDAASRRPRARPTRCRRRSRGRRSWSSGRGRAGDAVGPGQQGPGLAAGEGVVVAGQSSTTRRRLGTPGSGEPADRHARPLTRAAGHVPDRRRHRLDRLAPRGRGGRARDHRRAAAGGDRRAAATTRAPRAPRPRRWPRRCASSCRSAPRGRRRPRCWRPTRRPRARRCHRGRVGPPVRRR